MRGGRNKVREREKEREADRQIKQSGGYLMIKSLRRKKKINREEKKNITVNEKELYRLQMDKEENERMF